MYWVWIAGILILLAVASGALIYLWRFLRLADIVPRYIRAIWQQTDDGLLVLGIHNQIVELNEPAATILGYTMAELIEQPITAVLPQSIPLFPAITNTLRTEINLNEQAYIVHITPLYDWRQQQKGHLLILQDISQMRSTINRLEGEKQLFQSLIALSSSQPNWNALQPVLKHGIQKLMHEIGAEMGNLLIINSASVVTHTILTQNGSQANLISGSLGQVLPKGLINTLNRQKETIIIESTTQDRHWSSAPFKMGSVIATPLQHGQNMFGVLAFLHPAEHFFEQDHVALLETAVSQISLILHKIGGAESEQVSDRQIIPYKVLRAVGESLEPETVAYIAVETIADLTDWPTVAISMPNNEGKLVIRAAVGVPFTDEGINGRAFRTGHTQILPDPDDPFPQFAGYGMPQSALAVPLRRGRQQLGVLNIESDEIEAFNEEDILLAESLADAIVLAIDNARLFSQAQSRLTEQTVLRKAMSVITSTLDLNTVLYSLAEQMGQVMKATSAYICSYDADQATMTILANYFGPRSSDPERASDVGVTYSLPDTFPGTMAYLEMGEPLLAYVDDPNIPASKRQHILSFGGFTSLVIPLQAGGKTIAYAEIWESQERREFSPEEIHLCQDIAQQAAVTIENARLFKGIADERGRLQALIESDRDGIILVSVQGLILVINQPALTFLQMNEAPDYWIRRPFMSMVKHLRKHAPPLARIATTEMRRISQGHLDTNEGEYELAPRAVHWRSLPVMADENEIGRLLVLRDITEERLLENMQDDLIHTMVHDLRSPLTSISITLDLLDLHLGDSDNPKIERTLERARQSTVRMLAMVNAILDISRLESGHMEITYKPSTLNSIVNTVIDMQTPQAIEKKLELKQDIPKDLPMVWIDSALVERVLQNLVGNAIKFTPEEGTVQITAEIHDVEPDCIIVSVSDTGSGIPKDLRNRLFEKFATGGQRERGSGLGLAFCKMAIEAHGQRIWLANSSAKGTTFQFTLSFSPPNGRSE